MNCRPSGPYECAAARARCAEILTNARKAEPRPPSRRHHQDDEIRKLADELYASHRGRPHQVLADTYAALNTDRWIDVEASANEARRRPRPRRRDPQRKEGIAMLTPGTVSARSGMRPLEEICDNLRS